MLITESTNDQMMITAAHRYCLGRSSYAVGCCIEFLTQHWEQLSENTQNVILRDTIDWVNDIKDEEYDEQVQFLSSYIQNWIDFVRKHFYLVDLIQGHWIIDNIRDKYHPSWLNPS